MLFSVITPVYKVEKYLGQTVDSVLAQTCADFELILVDDGSPDGSPALCDEAARLDSRVRAVHKPNGGPSSARNEGIRQAQGEYLVFLDGDDRLPSDALELIGKAIEGAAERPDVLVARYMEFEEQTRRWKPCGYALGDLGAMDGQQALLHLFGQCAGFRWAIWKQAYRRQFIVENNILFDESLWINEDGNWLLEVLTKARRFAGINDVIYHYRNDNPGSIVHTRPGLGKYRNSNFVYSRWFAYFDREYPKGPARDCMLGLLARGYINSAKGIWRIQGEEGRQAVALFNAHPEIPPRSGLRVHRLLLPVRRVFGTRAFLWLVWLSHEVKQRLSRRTGEANA